MATINSKTNTSSADFAANAQAMQAQVDDLKTTVEKIHQGGGTKAIYDVATALSTALKYKSFGGVQLQAARLLPSQENKDWYTLPLSFSFYTDTL